MRKRSWRTSRKNKRGSSSYRRAEEGRDGERERGREAEGERHKKVLKLKQVHFLAVHRGWSSKHNIDNHPGGT